MKFSEKLKKAIGSAIFWYQAVVYFAIVILQAAYPKASALQQIIAGIIFLAILVLIIAAGFKTDEQISTKSIGGGGVQPPDGGDGNG